MTTTIRALLATDDRTTFACGDVELDRFFRQFAGQNQFKNYIGTTYVAVDADGSLLGYATVAPGALEFDAVPARDRKSVPKYPLPILRLARLAVREDRQGQGMGPALLRYVFQLALKMGEELGCFAVVVDAYETAVSFYQGYGFIPIIGLEGGSSTRPATSQMFLALKKVKAAAGKKR